MASRSGSGRGFRAAQEIDGGGDEELESDHRGNRIARQSEDEGVAAAAEDRRLARANSNRVKIKFGAQTFQTRFRPDRTSPSRRRRTGPGRPRGVPARFWRRDRRRDREAFTSGTGSPPASLDLRGERDGVAVANVEWARAFRDRTTSSPVERMATRGFL